MNIKFVLSSVLLLVALSFSNGKQLQAQSHTAMEIVELAANASVIVRGTISEVKGATFVVNVEYCLAGDVGAVLEIKKFRNNKTARRWTKYAPDQKVLLFLKGPEDDLEIMGINGEGEKAVEGDDVLLDGRGGGVKNKYAYKNLSTGSRIYAETVLLSDFEEAVILLRRCYQVTYDPVTNNANETTLVPTATLQCDDNDQEAVHSISEVALMLASKADKL